MIRESAYRESRNGIPFVLLGRLRIDRADEVWTRSRKLFRKLRARLDREHSYWWDRYKSDSGTWYDRPFLTRNIAERELLDCVDFDDVLFFTKISKDHSAAAPGLGTERLFDLLVEDKVLVHPTQRDYKPVAWTTLSSKSEVRKATSREKVWMVNQPNADLWVSTRLLILEDS